MKKLFDNQQDGYVVLITVLVVGIIAVTISAFLLITGQSSSISAASVYGDVQSQSAAKGCSQLALLAIQQNPASPSPLTGSETLDSTINETCTYTISGANPNYSISALGSVMTSSTTYYHQITITTNATSPSVTFSSWQDTPY